MNQFKLNKITSALIAAGLAMPAGVAFAQDVGLAVAAQGPKAGAAMFVGKAGTALVRVATTTTSPNAGTEVVTVNCFSGTTAVGVPQALTLTTIGSGSQEFTGVIGAAVCGTVTTGSVVLVYAAQGLDTIGGTVNTFAVLTNAGTVGIGGTTGAVATALAGALAGGTNLIAVNANYVGPIVSSASQTGVGAVTLNFNAQLAGTGAGTGTVGAAAGVNTVALKSFSGAAINSGFGGGGTAAATAGVQALSLGAATFGNAATNYTSAVNKVTLVNPGAQIFDTAGNQTPGQTVYTNFSNTSGVAFASGTAKAVADSFTLATQTERVDFWNPVLSTKGQTSGNFLVTLRTNEALTLTSTTAISLTPPMNIVATGAAGTDLNVVVGISAGTEIGVNSSGQVVVSTDNWVTAPTPMTIGLASNTTSSTSVSASGTAIGTSGVTAVAVMAGPGSLPSLAAMTLDSDVDGFLDGFSARAHNVFGLPYTAAEPSFTGTAGLSLVNMTTGTLTHASTTVASATNQLNVSLVNKSADDWDGNGVAGNAADVNRYNLASFGTAVVNSSAAAPGLPFQFVVAGITPTTGTAALTYANSFRASDGGLQPLNNAETTLPIAAFIDNANPVAVKIAYTVKNAQGKVVAGQARDEYGDVVISFSEAVEGGAIGEILFAGQPVSLKNLDKNIPEKVQLTNVAGEDPKTGLPVPGAGIKLTFVPKPLGDAVTFSTVGPNATDITETGAANSTDPDLLALANAGPSAAAVNAVAAAAVVGLQITGARLANVFTGAGATEINAIVVDFSQNVTTPTGATAANLDGLFVVRARVGSTRGGAFEDRNATSPASGSISSFYDFSIPSANMFVGTAPGSLGGPASVTLMIPAEASSLTNTSPGLPTDTTAIWVDYEGNDGTGGNVGSKRNLRLATNQATFGPDGSTSTFFGTAVAGNVSVNGSATNVIDVDADTFTVTFSPTQLASNAGRRATRNLLTQTIVGTATTNGAIAMANNTAIRADLIIFETGIGLAGTPPREATVADGNIDIRRGPNSEAGTSQTVALKNNAVNSKDVADYNKAIRDFNAAVTSRIGFPTVNVTNLARQAELIKPERDAFLAKFNADIAPNAGTVSLVPLLAGDVNALNGHLFAYVEVTTGVGKDASPGTNGANQNNANGNANGNTEAYSQNANAEFGRTATLSRVLPNARVNGTTYYPVDVSLRTGAITGQGGLNAVTGGNLNGVFPDGAGVLGTPASSRDKGFRVLDTAFSLVQGGNYHVIVGAAEANFTATSTAILPATNVAAALTGSGPQKSDAFVQVAVFDSATNEYKLATQADPSFGGGSATTAGSPVNHIRFQQDLSRLAGTVPTRLNINRALIGESLIRTLAGWQLVGLVGDMNRSATAPLSGRFFMTADPVSGRPITNFEADNKSRDEAFTLGLSQTPVAAANELKVAFDGPGGTSVVTINPKAGAGLAFNYNQGFVIGNDGAAGSRGPATMSDEITGVPLTPAPGLGAGDGRLNDVVSTYPNGLKLFYPIKAAFPATQKLAKNSWHLITIQTDRVAGLNAVASLAGGIDAVIIVDGGTGAKAWFRNEAATTAAGDAIVLKKGDAIFVHVGSADVTGFAF